MIKAYRDRIEVLKKLIEDEKIYISKLNQDRLQLRSTSFTEVVKNKNMQRILKLRDQAQNNINRYEYDILVLENC